MSKQYIITNAGRIEVFNEYAKLRQFSKAEGEDDMQVSDGYHTMDELYDHRITIFIALCKQIELGSEVDGMKYPSGVWRSKRHSDGELCFGTGTQFVLGIGTEAGKQITYHIPIERWGETEFADELEKAPEWDGHTSNDVLERLKGL